MKKIISVLVMVGALSQMVNAMGPMGDITRRHFYKDQEWIWQSTLGEQKSRSDTSATINAIPIHIWLAPVASTPPFRPPLASTPPFRPPSA